MTKPWDELAEGVYRRRYDSLRLNVGLILGAEGALLIDTRASHVEARQLIADLALVTSLPVRWVVNTHFHWDHVFGNALFPDAELWGHERCRDYLTAHPDRARQDALAWLGEESREVIDEVEVVPPNHTVAERAAIDLGGRTVTMEWLGRGHTDSDLVVGVSGSDVVFAGDLLEDGVPLFGDGFPLAWGSTVAALAARKAGAVVPGHGDVMSPAQVATQAEELAAVAKACREGLAEGSFDPDAGPYPSRTMRVAWRRAQEEAR